MHTMSWMRAALGAALLGLLGLLAACGGGGGDGNGGSGTLRVALTDNPACGYDEVVVTVNEVRVHTADAPDSDPGWRSIPVNPPLSVNLLDYTNGALLNLGQTRVPAGTYTRLRLVLAPNTGAQADRNWIVLSGNPGVRVPLKTPSGQQSGLKVQTSLAVQRDGLTDVVIDFDACRSVVVAGGSGQYLLKPVLRTLPRVETGVIGEVSLAAATAGASVSLQQNGEVRRATVADANGLFKLQPVEPGEYTLVVVTPGRATAAVRQLQVFSGQLVRAAPAGQRIDPPASGTAIFTGQVSLTPVPTELDATVALRQTLTAGDTLTLVERPVNAVTGEYAYTGNAVAAPQVAQHAAGSSLSFSADNAAAGQFTLRATTGGVSKTAGPLTAAASDTIDQDFVFP
ncbi:MAG: DUF4382 domain-containing protein [Comamonadaceae bacterium]|jgi:hypothetical protein|uniref:DUF4382 domain-containing protein n=1 Tax=Hydrogenophaga borbori TaxID=2294117 RepID=A0A372EHE0_9BURK|nr:DUF4382 domain-containing protein [Hydrogenophaga borbori]NCT97648.1 DUF4382 domain-containing protein [Comamonadaceae bacterium]RFP77872.1 DUF4382 domain-containing protein [Hydrogenophaga borbori]